MQKSDSHGGASSNQRGVAYWKPIRRFLALCATVLCLAYFGVEAARYSDAVMKLRWTWLLVATMSGALLMQIGCALLDAWSWRWLLKLFEVPTTLRQSLAVFSMAQAAKYLPGNIAQHVGRVVLARQAGWHSERVILSVLIENLFALGAGGVLSVSGLMISTGPIDDSRRLIVAAAVMTLGWLVMAILFRRTLADPPMFLRKCLTLDAPLPISHRDLVLYLGIHLVSFIFMGCSLILLLWGLAGNCPPAIWLVPCGVAVAWIAGFVIPGAPAGLGIREAVLTLFLSPHIEIGVVISAALLWRVISLVADAFLAGVGFSLSRTPGDTPA
ncbi:lysylphosphatidylglycerol synthase transmembrane domain-containing protein [Geobacter sp. SVR]|uniref:lysylphosphatidylglycerol synthase transmembrane domain-containing protein n=1 Tax=Geobacter sp. SVR TaxID=2495594 RepID=UPI002103E03B|nr:lysylphosphatidylglycerol synthase transmembrane domain-containing protein [Geobacter sp. SVR]